MSDPIYTIHKQWPWVRRAQKTVDHKPTVDGEPLTVEHKEARRWAVLQDGTVGYIHHQKTDGNVGFRPTSPQGDHLPNQSPHWSAADRLKVPHEVAVHPDALRDALPHEIPAEWRI
jgi:hypothetical protein